MSAETPAFPGISAKSALRSVVSLWNASLFTHFAEGAGPLASRLEERAGWRPSVGVRSEGLYQLDGYRLPGRVTARPAKAVGKLFAAAMFVTAGASMAPEVRYISHGRHFDTPAGACQGANRPLWLVRRWRRFAPLRIGANQYSGRSLTGSGPFLLMEGPG